MEIDLPFNYTPRDYQIPFWEAADSGRYKRFYLLWHRRGGKDISIWNFVIREAFKRPGLYYYFLPTFTQAKRVIWDGMTNDGGRFIDFVPPLIVKNVNHSEMKIELVNGSIIQLIGTDRYDAIRGSNPIMCVFSEYAWQNPQAWEVVKPILNLNGGIAIFDTTPAGDNHARNLWDMAVVNPEWFTQKLTVDDTGLLTREDMDRERGEGTSEEMIQQEYFCFPPGTNVWTDKGQKPIESIELGDVVLSHAGRWRKVERLHRRDYEGELVSIKSAGMPIPLRCTPNHPVRVCDPATQTYRWVRAEEVAKGDFVVLPRVKPPAASVVDAELVELIGWFIAEGSVAKNLVQISLGKHEKARADRVMKIASKFGKAVQLEGQTALNVTIYSCFLADLLTSHCGSGSRNKRIPWSLIGGHEEILYETLIDGDGCRGDYSGVEAVYTTISQTLAYDVQMLAHVLGKRATISLRPKEKQTQMIEGRKCLVSDSYGVRISARAARKKTGGPRRVRPQKHGVASMVASVGVEQYSGPVYNFKVQYDESYVADGRVVHNCSFDSPVQGSFYGDLIRKAEEGGRITSIPYETGLPVDTWWDLGVGDDTAIWFSQSIGNEVRFIDCYNNSGQGLPHYISVLQSKGYVYGNHYGPHDLAVREYTSGKSRIEIAQSLGIRFEIAPKLSIDDGINAVRMIFNRCWFDKIKCEPGLSALKNYKREYDERRKAFKPIPFHDWASHYSDAFRYFAVSHKKAVGSLYTEEDRILNRYAII